MAGRRVAKGQHTSVGDLAHLAHASSERKRVQALLLAHEAATSIDSLRFNLEEILLQI